MWGVIPAAGSASRIQPLAFSKELLPVGRRIHRGTEQPRAVSEYLVERMILGGANKLCFVIGPRKSDILEYYSAIYADACIAYVVQPKAAGLCDAVFRTAPLIASHEQVIVGLPDTVWFPEDALSQLPNDALSFLLFPVDEPQFFDAVVVERSGRVKEIQVKQPNPASRWVWGAFKIPGYLLSELEQLWRARNRRDEYIGTLVNAWLEQGGEAIGIKAGSAYVDVGTLEGYRAAMSLLQSGAAEQCASANGHDDVAMGASPP